MHNNFDVEDKDKQMAFQHQGWWYNIFLVIVLMLLATTTLR